MEHATAMQTATVCVMPTKLLDVRTAALVIMTLLPRTQGTVITQAAKAAQMTLRATLTQRRLKTMVLATTALVLLRLQVDRMDSTSLWKHMKREASLA